VYRPPSDPDPLHKFEYYTLRVAGAILIFAWVVKHVIEDLVRLFK
jgi:hypothetical protein